MRRSLALAGLILCAAPAAAAQTSVPASSGGSTSPFGTNLAGRITGFGDSAPGGLAASSNVASSLPVVSTLAPSNPFHPAGLFLTPRTPANAAPGIELVAAPATTAAPAAAPATVRARTTFAGGVGPRRFGMK